MKCKFSLKEFNYATNTNFESSIMLYAQGRRVPEAIIFYLTLKYQEIKLHYQEEQELSNQIFTRIPPTIFSLSSLFLYKTRHPTHPPPQNPFS